MVIFGAHRRREHSVQIIGRTAGFTSEFVGAIRAPLPAATVAAPVTIIVVTDPPKTAAPAMPASTAAETPPVAIAAPIDAAPAATPEAMITAVL